MCSRHQKSAYLLGKNGNTLHILADWAEELADAGIAQDFRHYTEWVEVQYANY